MTEQELETIYEALASAIDFAGHKQSELLLAKIALALSDEIEDQAIVLSIIEECKAGLDAPPID